MGKLRIQKLIFEKKIFNNRSKIKKWIKLNNFIIDNRLKRPIMKFDKTFGVRQRNPDWFKKSTFKLKTIDKGVKALEGNLK